MRLHILTSVSMPVFLRRFHGVATIVWLILFIPSILWWKDSILWVVLMSAYAAFIGHFSSWQAARVEVKQDVEAEET